MNPLWVLRPTLLQVVVLPLVLRLTVTLGQTAFLFLPLQCHGQWHPQAEFGVRVLQLEVSASVNWGEATPSRRRLGLGAPESCAKPGVPGDNAMLAPPQGRPGGAAPTGRPQASPQSRPLARAHFPVPPGPYVKPIVYLFIHPAHWGPLRMPPHPNPPPPLRLGTQPEPLAFASVRLSPPH